MLEENLGRAVQKAGGLQFLWERPMTLTLLIVAFTLLVAPFVTDHFIGRQRRKS
jgi:putative tricarboxylic transport membrane protein